MQSKTPFAATQMWVLLIVFHLLACGAPQPAPELRGIDGWINSGPLTLEELRGQVVLLDFWTYC